MKKALPMILGFIIIAGIGATGYYLYSKSQEEEPSEHTGETELSTEVAEPRESPSAPTTIKNVLLVLGPDGYNDQEYTDTKATIEAANYQVTVASKGVTTARGMNGGTADVDIDISNANAEDYIAIVFIGGSGAHDYFDDETALGLAKDFYNSGKVTAAICSAPTILANANLLDGKNATCYPGYEDNLTSKGATYTAEAVTVDGLIVTGNGPDAAKEFGGTVADQIEKY